MRAIARSTALICLVAALASADSHDDVMQVFTSMAGALTEVNVAKFMQAFSKSMPDYDAIQDNVTGLVRQSEVSSAIEPVNEDGDDHTLNIDLDWSLEVRSLEQDGPIVQRRQVVHCQLRKEQKGWKIVSLKPLNFFAPPALGR